MELKIIKPTPKFTPLHDNVLLADIQVVEGETNLHTTTVLAVGPGVETLGGWHTPPVCVGDVVYMPNEASRITIAGESYILCKDRSIPGLFTYGDDENQGRVDQ